MFSWDQIYEMELENFQDHGDEGEIWFGKGVERKVIDWIKKNCSSENAIENDQRILDLGCGNGHFTLKLIESGWTKVSALDYSERAVELAKKLIASSFNDNGQIQIFQADILSPDSIPEEFRNSFDLIVDKGTFDAISLNPNFGGKSKTETIAESFKATLKTLYNYNYNNTKKFNDVCVKNEIVKNVNNTDTSNSDNTTSNADPTINADPTNNTNNTTNTNNNTTNTNSSLLFIITSCNWTSKELETIFAPEFKAIDEVLHNKFVFGGKSGQDVSTVIFKLEK